MTKCYTNPLYLTYLYLRRNIEASSHTLSRRLPLSTNSAAYQRPVLSIHHSPSQMSVLHLRSNRSTSSSSMHVKNHEHMNVHSTRWSQILDQNCDFCLPLLYSTSLLDGFPSEYCHDVCYGKTRML